MAKRRKKAVLVPRLGPPENLRPAGAHADKRRKTRGETTRAALREEAALDIPRHPADNDGGWVTRTQDASGP